MRRICELDEDYPVALRDLRSPPRAIYTLGSVDVLRAPVVAIVGTRDSTPYGERVARELAAALVRSGACVVSGLARGIDAAAHRSALETAEGSTAAVLGTGVDVPYPVGHRSLHAAIARHGVVISEFEPGARAVKGCFPRRNRIIAGLARLTIVVEAGLRSGALVTAAHALELGRDVAAVPGPIDQPASAASNALIRDGAHAITSIDDALSLAALEPPPRAAAPQLEGAEQVVWEALAAPVATVEELISRAGLPASAALAALTGLELRRLIVCELNGVIRRRL